MNWTTFWAAASAIAAALALVSGFFAWIVNFLVDRKVQPLREDNFRLQKELETRLALPRFSLDAIELTEKAAERRIKAAESRIEEIEHEYAIAIEAKDEEASLALDRERSRVRELLKHLEKLQYERKNVKRILEGAPISNLTSSQNAVGLHTGEILLVRYESK